MTIAEMLKLCDEALATIDYARRSEWQLARALRDILTARGSLAKRVNVINGEIVVSDHAPKMDNSHVHFRIYASAARSLAAALLLAADEAERSKPEPERLPMYGRCPMCREISPDGTKRDKRPDGNTTCGWCKATTPSRDWSTKP